MPPKKKSKKEEEDNEVKVQDETKEDEQMDEVKMDEEKIADAAGRIKRKRRDLTNYEPEDFTLASSKAAAKVVHVVPGRGSKLADLESVKASIEKCSAEYIPVAYKFLFGSRGKPTKKEMKQNLLEFSGYLPPLPNGKKFSDEELEKYDEEYEVSHGESSRRQIPGIDFYVRSSALPFAEKQTR